MEERDVHLRCKRHELALITSAIDHDDCTKQLIGRGVVKVARIDLWRSLAAGEPVWMLADTVPCPKPGCGTCFGSFPDRCLTPLRGGPSKGDEQPDEAPRVEVFVTPAGADIILTTEIVQA